MTSQILATPPTVKRSTPDHLLITADPSIGIDAVKTLQRFLQTGPNNGYQKTVSLYPADKLTLPAQNALLKILEEPPEYALIQLHTSEPHKLLETVRSRCEHILTKPNLDTPDSSLTANPIFQLLNEVKNPTQSLSLSAKVTLDRPEMLIALTSCLSLIAQELSHNPSRELARRSRLLLQTYQLTLYNVSLPLIKANLFLHWAN